MFRTAFCGRTIIIAIALTATTLGTACSSEATGPSQVRASRADSLSILRQSPRPSFGFHTP
jgi:hypothetical protein